MSIEKAARAILTADGTVSGLVATRVYPIKRPQGTALPAVIYELASETVNDALPSQGSLKRARLSVQSFASTYGGVKTLAAAIRAALINYNGTTSGATIDSLREEVVNDLGEERSPGSDEGVYRIVADYVAWYT